MLDLALSHAVALLAVCVVVIAVSGTLMAGLADMLADRTGWGEALVGGVLLGAATSMSGALTSVTAAAEGQPALAVSNAVGGIAAQTLFLAIADLTYRQANLEHAAASVTNILQAAILSLLLALPIGAALAPDFTVYAVHPVTPLLVAVYIGGLKLADGTRTRPMWVPRQTANLETDEPDEESFQGPSTPALAARFAVLLVVLSVAGWATAQAGITIARETGLAQSLVGALLTATATSVPELVTTIAAVRRGALTLAVGGIIGGNSFDVLFLVAADVAYREGSIYHAVGAADLFMFPWAIAMTLALLIGLICRERSGIGGIGFESAGLIALYIAGIALQTVMM